MGNARFFEDVEFGEEDNIRSVVFEEEQENNQDQVLIPDVVFCPNIALDIAQAILPNIVQDVVMVQDNNEVLLAQDNIDQVILPDIVQDDASAQDNNEVLSQEPIAQTQQPQEVPLKRSTRERRSVIPNYYIVFLQEHEVDVNLAEDDPINLQQALQSSNSHKWIDAMKDEMKSMEDNDVWDLVELPKGSKPIGCKWIFKTKRDSNGNVERYKALLVTKGFTQKEGIDYKETFSLVSTKYSFRTIMALVAHFDLEGHQMDVKTVFLNGNIDETIYMVQPENFVFGDPKSMVCKLKKSIYGFKQASCEWYHKFH